MGQASGVMEMHDSLDCTKDVNLGIDLLTGEVILTRLPYVGYP